MVCDICGKRGARIRRVTRSFGKGKATFLIEAVPIVSCPKCGESYLTADTLREVERIRQKRRRLTKGRLVPVATFGGGWHKSRRVAHAERRRARGPFPLVECTRIRPGGLIHG